MFNNRNNRRRVPLKERCKGAGTAVVSACKQVVPLVVLAVVAVGVPVGVFQGYLHVVSTPYFALDDVQVKGLQSLERADVLEHAGVVEGVNVFDVDPDAAQMRLETLPWVRSAKVEKRLPGTLTISIEERTPVALLIDDSAYVLIDGQGEPFKQLEPHDPVDELLELPLISGLSRAEAQGELGQQLIIEALEVVRLAQAQNLPRLSEVHIDPVMGLSMVPAESGIEIRLGRGNYAARVERLRAVFAAIERDGRDVDYILVDQDDSLDRITVGSRATATGNQDKEVSN